MVLDISYRSIVQTIGATRSPAAAADAASAPARSPRFCVFHLVTLCDSRGLCTTDTGRIPDTGTFKAGATVEDLVAAPRLPRVSSCTDIEVESTRVASRSQDSRRFDEKKRLRQVVGCTHCYVYSFGMTETGTLARLAVLFGETHRRKLTGTNSTNSSRQSPSRDEPPLWRRTTKLELV